LVKTIGIAHEDLRTFMTIVVTSVTSFFFCYYGYQYQKCFCSWYGCENVPEMFGSAHSV